MCRMTGCWSPNCRHLYVESLISVPTYPNLTWLGYQENSEISFSNASTFWHSATCNSTFERRPPKRQWRSIVRNQNKSRRPIGVSFAEPNVHTCSECVRTQITSKQNGNRTASFARFPPREQLLLWVAKWLNGSYQIFKILGNIKQSFINMW
jgi:hypothetical protein